MKVFIVGPGGVGKTTSGGILAKLLSYSFVDLDLEFKNRIGSIEKCIKDYGYGGYAARNSELFFSLVNEFVDDFVMPLSSGFLAHEGMSDLTEKHSDFIHTEGTVVRLLPSRSLDKSTRIVVARQLQRGFNLKEENEIKKFQTRYPIYKKQGHIKLYSHEDPDTIAKKMYKRIQNVV